MTFTDMLMLLVVMFVLFLSFSEINSDSFKQNAGAISEAFNQAPSTSVLPGYSSVVDLSRSNINVESMGSQAGINTIEKNEKKTIDFAERKYKKDDEFKPAKIDPKYVGKKMSRNEPCFCGSGKKYKKCCGAL